MDSHTPHNEDARIDLLNTLQLMNATSEEAFDRLAQLAARLFDCPIALIAFADRDKLYFKSRVGLDLLETPCGSSFCSRAINAEKLLVINDAQQDARFTGNPLVSSTPGVRFYAGVPIFSSRGIALGTLCIMDFRPRELSETEILSLQDMAEIARREIIHRESAGIATHAPNQFSRH